MQNMKNAVHDSQSGSGTKEVLSAEANTKGFILHMAGAISSYSGSNSAVRVDGGSVLRSRGAQNVNGHSSTSDVLPYAMIFPAGVALTLATGNSGDEAWCWYEVLT